MCCPNCAGLCDTVYSWWVNSSVFQSIWRLVKKYCANTCIGAVFFNGNWRCFFYPSCCPFIVFSGNRQPPLFRRFFSLLSAVNSCKMWTTWLSHFFPLTLHPQAVGTMLIVWKKFMYFHELSSKLLGIKIKSIFSLGRLSCLTLPAPFRFPLYSICRNKPRLQRPIKAVVDW